jgi:acetyl coenzyme A synthetase (ADP forming)-like protein
MFLIEGAAGNAMLKDLFNPESIAVIGASRDTKKVGYAVLNNLIRFGYPGKIHPINPSAGEILGLKSYSSLVSVNQPVDLAIICLPAPSVPGVMKECGEAGVKAAVVITAGFKEAGHEGLALDREMISIARDYGIRVLGPNCLGVINTSNKMNAAFGGEVLKGRTAFFSQSGALGVAIMDWALEHNFGFSKFISLGNKSDLNESDFLEYFIDDPETDIILGYIEDVIQGRRFMEIARRSTHIKPVILIKSGGTASGARAASSHTGALAGSETAFAAAFKQTGIIRACGIQDLFDLALAFSGGKLPVGDRLLIITNAGGPGIIAADAADKLGIDLSPMTRASIDAVAPRLPSNASLYNPIDIIGDATSDRYAAVLNAAVADPSVDGILLLLTPQAMTDVDNIADMVIKISSGTEKPIISAFIGGKTVRKAGEKLKMNAVPSFEYPEVAVRAYKRLCDFAVARTKKSAGEYYRISSEGKAAVRSMIDALRITGNIEFGEESAMQILMHYGFTFPRYGLARSSKSAAEIGRRLGFPVVMKIASPDILHKTDLGGVKLHIDSAESAEDAFTEITTNARRFMPDAYISGVMLYQMIGEGKEVILGVTYDRTFGHMIMLGLGGIYVEVLNDVSFRIAPVSRDEAGEMVTELRSVALLRGARGEQPADIEAIVDGIMKVSALVTDFPEIRELDINPFKVMNKGAFALDSRIIFEPRA